MIDFKCRLCDKALRVEDHRAGMFALCDRCGGATNIPAQPRRGPLWISEYSAAVVLGVIFLPFLVALALFAFKHLDTIGAFIAWLIGLIVTGLGYFLAGWVTDIVVRFGYPSEYIESTAYEPMPTITDRKNADTPRASSAIAKGKLDTDLKSPYPKE